jgi:hypothetical protein
MMLQDRANRQKGAPWQLAIDAAIVQDIHHISQARMMSATKIQNMSDPN